MDGLIGTSQVHQREGVLLASTWCLSADAPCLWQGNLVIRRMLLVRCRAGHVGKLDKFTIGEDTRVDQGHHAQEKSD